MSLIDRCGTFRFQIIDSGIAEKETGTIQWVAQLKAVEYYDEETEQWIDWTEYEECEITAYLTLFGKDNQPIFHAKQLQKALGWSGAAFEELETKYVADVVFQGLVKEETYQSKTTKKIAQVDAYDAEPGRILQKLDTDEVKKLSAKFTAQLRTLSGGVKPQSVPAKPNRAEAKAAKKEELEEKATRGKVAEAKAPQPKSRPTPPKPPKKAGRPKKEEQEVVEKGAAWVDCCVARDKSISDKELENTWHDAVDLFGGEDVIEEKGLWGKVKDKVIVEVGKMPI